MLRDFLKGFCYLFFFMFKTCIFPTMSSKSLILLLNVIIILVLLSSSTHSAPLIERDIPSTRNDADPFIGQYIDPLEQDSDMLIDLLLEESLSTKQDTGPFFCQHETNLSCCPLLARKVVSQHHSRAASVVL